MDSESNKSFSNTWLLSLFLGTIAADRFYLELYPSAFLKLLANWLPGIGLFVELYMLHNASAAGLITFITLGCVALVWNISDFIRISFGKRKDKLGKPLGGYSRNYKKLQTITKIYTGLLLLSCLTIIPMFRLFHALDVTRPDAEVNANQDIDVGKLQAAFESYRTKYGAWPQTVVRSSTPQTLNLCGIVCTADNTSTVKLSYYATGLANVIFHDYAHGLTSPNPETLYVVENAECDSNLEVLSQQTVPGPDSQVAFVYREKRTDVNGKVFYKNQCGSYATSISN